MDASISQSKFWMLDLTQLVPIHKVKKQLGIQGRFKNLKDEDRQQLALHYQKTALSADAAGFPKGSLSQVVPMSGWPELETALRLLFFFLVAILFIPSVIYFACFRYNRLAQVILFLIILSQFLPLTMTPSLPKFLIRYLRAVFFYAFYRNNTYWSIKVIWEEKIGVGPYIFVTVPHGYIPCAFGNVAQMLPYIWGTKPIRVAVADFFFRIPLLRELMEMFNTISASQRTILKTLNKGDSVALIPDGIAGMFHSNDKDDTVFLAQHRGAARLALMSGTSIVPSFVFGSTQIVHCWYDPWRIIETISRKIRFPLVIFWGRYGFWIPYRIPQTVVFGPPIVVPKSTNTTPTEEEISSVHEKVMKSIIDLHEKHKNGYGWTNRCIKII